MDLFGIKAAKKLDIVLKAMQSNNLAASFSNFSTQIFPTWRIIQEMDAYQTMAFIYAVVSKLATTSAMIPFYGYDKKNDTDLPESDPLSKFLETLDFEQKEILYTYLYLCGEVFMYKERIELGVNAGAFTVRFLHPGRVVLVLSQSFPVQVIGYKYQDTTNGVAFDIPMEDVIFIKLPNPSVDTMEEWRGLSPMKVLSRTINRMQAEEDVTVAQLQNGGVPGIVYNKTLGLAPDVVSRQKDNFGRFIRNKDNKGAPYFAGYEMGHIALGTPLTDMEVNALALADQSMVCNVFGVSKVLFNDTSASTESNVQEMIKEMYTNTIIPNITRVEGRLNKDLVPELKTKGIIKADTSEIKALQEDQLKLVQALKDAWWLEGNEKRDRMSYDKSTNPLMGQFIIPSGMMLIDDLNIVVPDVDNTAGDYVAPADANKNPKVVPLKTGTNG